jgi:hypothetical protein
MPVATAAPKVGAHLLTISPAAVAVVGGRLGVPIPVSLRPRKVIPGSGSNLAASKPGPSFRRPGDRMGCMPGRWSLTSNPTAEPRTRGGDERERGVAQRFPRSGAAVCCLRGRGRFPDLPLFVAIVEFLIVFLLMQ